MPLIVPPTPRGGWEEQFTKSIKDPFDKLLVAYDREVPVFYPEAQGARADGRTDSTEGFKWALGAVGSSGGTIRLRSGVYLVDTEKLVVSIPGTVIQGCGAPGPNTGTIIKAKSGSTGKLLSFAGSAWNSVLDRCQLNDVTLLGADQAVIGLSLKWLANLRLRNVFVMSCLDHGIYMEQVWDSSFYDLEVQWCGSQSNSKNGLFIYNGANDNSNNLRFYSFRAEHNFGNDVRINAAGAGYDNLSIIFFGGKCEREVSAGSFSTKAFHIDGWNGSSGKGNQNIVIRDMLLASYYASGNIAVHFEGAGFMVADNNTISNIQAGGTGMKVEGPVLGDFVHLLTNNHFTNVDSEIVIASSIPRDRVWTDGNRKGIWNGSDHRIHINSDLVRDRRRLVFISEVADHPTSGTGEDDLSTVTIPASVMWTYGGLHIRAAGWVEGVAGNKTIKLKFGSQSVTLFGPAALITTWKFEAEVRNAGAHNSQVLTWRFFVDGVAAAVSSGFVSFAEATNVDVVVKPTGECANGADIIHQTLYVVEEE